MLRLSSLVVSWWLVGASFAQEPAVAPAAEPKLVHLRVIGASVSGGFMDGPLTGAAEPGDTVSMHHLLKAWCGERAKASTHSPTAMMLMFTAPERIGGEQVKAAQKAKPEAVVAVDFPFWFAYGYVGGDESTARRALLQKGLELLATLEVPVVIGDLPDFQGAAARMLAPAQIPSPAVLQQLNADLAAWAAEHKNVRQVPLAATVAQMKTAGVVLPLATGPLATPPGALLQGDRLHANRLGMAFLGHTLQPTLQQLFAADHPLRKQTWTFEQFVEACGAEADLEAVQATAKPKAGERKESAGTGAGR